jgi:transglutaminase-like putative cysteine protease
MKLPVQHPELGELQYETTVVRADPDGQVADTIALMRRYVLEDAGSDEVLRAIAEARAYEADPVAQVFWWVKSRLRFVHDEDLAAPWGSADIVEVLIRPRDMYSLDALRRGDCDDYVMMGAAMLARLGIAVHFVTVAAEPDDPGRFSHVYLAAYPGGVRIPLDASHGPRPGWEVSRVWRRREWPVRESALGKVVGMVLLGGAVYAGFRIAGVA